VLHYHLISVPNVPNPLEAEQVGVIDQRVEALAARQYGVFALWQLDGIGVRAGAVTARSRDGRLRRIHRGVYATGPFLSVRGTWMAATLAYGPSALLSHRPAGGLHELVEWRGGLIDVTAPARLRTRPGLRPHTAKLLAADYTLIDGIPTTSLARTLLDLAATLTPTQLQRAYEEAEARQALDVNAISDLLARSNGHRGVTPLAALLDYDPTAAAGAFSELERLFLDLLRANRIPLPLTNVLVDGFLVDAYWPDARLIVELDGYEFHRDREMFEADRRKLAQLRLAGHQALAFTYEQVVGDPSWVVDTVRGLLARDSAESLPSV
jgi:very-short-patch-repair endonuclease